jgi:hypothetical protein
MTNSQAAYISDLEDAIVEVEWEVEDLKASIREAAEEGGDTWIFGQMLEHAELTLRELQVDLNDAELAYMGNDTYFSK